MQGRSLASPLLGWKLEFSQPGRKPASRTLALRRVPVLFLSPLFPINSIFFFSPFKVSGSLISCDHVIRTRLLAELRKKSYNIASTWVDSQKTPLLSPIGSQTSWGLSCRVLLTSLQLLSFDGVGSYYKMLISPYTMLLKYNNTVFPEKRS